MAMRTLLLSSLLLASSSFAVDESNLNADGTEFKAPRLAGDSLPISADVQAPQVTSVSSVAEAFEQGSVKGLIRYSGQYRDSKLHVLQDDPDTDTSTEKKQQYSAIGGYLGYETAPLFYTSIGATFYTSHPLGNNPDDRLGLGGLNEDGGTANSYTVLGEAFVKFEKDDHKAEAGRREMPNYRFVSLSNIRMTPYTHEGYTYENTTVDGLQINLGYITKQKERNAEKFIDMAKAARIRVSSNGKQLIRGDYDPNDYVSGTGGYNGDKKQMSMLGLIYKQDGLTLEGWDYFVNDFVNTIYLYSDYSIKPSDNLTLTFAGQYANQQDTGDHVAGDIDTWFYGLKAQASLESGMTFFAAYNEVDYNEDSYDGGTIFVRWGTPQMFNSFQVQDSELAGTKSVGVGAQFELGKMGLVPNTVIRFRYADYDMPDSLSDTDARLDRTEATFDLRYSFTKNDGFGIFTQMDGLSVQFRVAYDNFDSISTEKANDYADRYGYELSTVTKDFVDTRLYLDYIF